MASPSPTWRMARGMTQLDRSKARAPRRTLHAIVVSLSAGALYGYNAGIISGTGHSVVSCSSVQAGDGSEEQNAQFLGFLVGSILFGAMVGSLTGVPIADRLGRVPAFQICSLLGIVAALAQMWTGSSFALLLLVRFVLGLPIGMLCTLVPLYVCETVPREVRGSVGTCMQIAIAGTLGLAQFTNYFFMPAYDPSDDDSLINCVQESKWRAQMVLGVVPGVLLGLHAFLFLPESAQWQQQRRAASQVGAVEQDPLRGELERGLLEATSTRMRASMSEGDQVIEPEAGLNDRVPALGHQDTSSSQMTIDSESEQDVEQCTWKEFLGSREGLGWALIGTGLACSTMLTGMDAIMFFGNTILQDAGVKDNVALVTALVIGLWNFSCVFIATVLVDKVGRRPLMIGALCGMTAANFTLFISYQFLEAGSTVASTVSLTGVMLFILSFEAGPGALFFLMASEAFPTKYRAKALPFTNFIQWIANILVALYFPVMNEGLGPAKTFLALGILAAASVVFCATVLKETK